MVSDVLALIPARGGSKGIPRKNVRFFAGAPLIAWSIAAAREARRVTRVIVSTDDAEIAEAARGWGAETPFLRPAELARDETTDLPVFLHALEWLQDHEAYRPDLVVQLRPTSPVRPVGLVDEAIARLELDPQAHSLRGVTLAGQTPYKMWRIEEGRMAPLLADGPSEAYNRPRQELPQVYWQTGHIDVIRAETLLGRAQMSGERIAPLVVDPRYAIDLDTPMQWVLAEQWIARADLPCVRPQPPRQPRLGRVRLLVSDFDGVLTDNRVLVSEDGLESVVCSRADGMGAAMLRAAGISVVVVSSEENPVVGIRCRKLGLRCLQGVRTKEGIVARLARQEGCAIDEAAYLGNDLNDLPALRESGCGIAVADAHPAVLAAADLHLRQRGGEGAFREVCDRILREKEAMNHV